LDWKPDKGEEMTTDRELMDMALDDLECLAGYAKRAGEGADIDWTSVDGDIGQDARETIKALRDRLAQPEPWVKTYCGGKPNYTTPAHEQPSCQESRQVAKNATSGWVGLTEDEFEEILAKYNEALPMVVCRAIEAKLKEKNT
jgi:hypothetical protein